MLQENIYRIRKWLLSLIKDKKKIVKISVVIFILLLALIFKISDSHREDVSVNVPEVSEETIVSEIYVDISGEVNKPGVYKSNEGTRLFEIIEMAGGLTSNADMNNINQAKFIEDGEKIVIPTITGNTLSDNSNANESSNNGLININTATKEQLMELNGVGDAIADRIIEYRSTTQFKSIEDIMCVKGIGNATFEKMKSQITV